MSFRSLRTLSALSLFSLLSTLTAFGGTRLVISQMYGGGGNTGAPFTYDFLELFNPTSSSIDLTGYSIQYVSATGTAWNAVALPSATIAPGHYYLIQAAAGTTVTGVNLPVTPDFTITGNGSAGNPLNFSATAGKIAIVNNATPLTTACPLGSTVVAFIGFGYEILGLSQARAGSQGVDPASDYHRRIEAARGQHCGDHGSSCRFAVHACDGDAVFEAHQLRQHFRALNDWNVEGMSLRNFSVACSNG